MKTFFKIIGIGSGVLNVENDNLVRQDVPNKTSDLLINDANFVDQEELAAAAQLVVEDKDGIEQFTSKNIRFEGFDFDPALDKIISLPPIGIQNVFFDGIGNEVEDVDTLALFFKSLGGATVNATGSIENFKNDGINVSFNLLRDVRLDGRFRPGQLGENVTRVEDKSGFIKDFGYQEFRNNTNIQRIVLPQINGTTDYDIENNTSLTHVELPKVRSVRIVNCPTLAYLDISAATTILSLTRCPITTLLADKVNSLTGEDTFNYFIGTLNLPELTTLNGNAFRGCGISKLIAPKLEKMPTASGTFRNMNNVQELYFPLLTEMNGTGRTFEMDGLNYFYAPLCKTFGTSHTLTQGLFDSGDIAGCVFVVNEFLKTSNAGNINANLQHGISRGANVIFASDVAMPVEIEVQDQDGIEQFTSKDIRFDGFTFDAALDKIIAPITHFNTFFIDASYGNDATGKMNSLSNSFKTLDAAITYYKANEPLVSNIGPNRCYNFELLTQGSYSVSQRLVQATDGIAGENNRKHIQINIYSNQEVNLSFNGTTEIECFMSYENAAFGAGRDSVDNILKVNVPAGRVYLNGEASIHFPTTSSTSTQFKCKIVADRFFHYGNKQICSLTSSDSEFRVRNLVVNMSGGYLVFEVISNNQFLYIPEITAISGGTLIEDLHEHCTIKFDKVVATNCFAINKGYTGTLQGTIIHGDYEFLGTGTCFYMNVSQKGGGTIHFPNRSIIKGDCQISGNSSTGTITLTGETAIYQDTTTLLKQLNFFEKRSDVATINMKYLYVFGQVCESMHGLTIIGGYLDIGSKLISALSNVSQANAMLTTTNLLTIKGNTIIKTRALDSFVVSSGALIAGTDSAKVLIEGDLTILGGSIQENANLEVVKTTTINRY